MQAKQSQRNKRGRARDVKEVEGNKNSLKSEVFFISFWEELKMSIFNIDTKQRLEEFLNTFFYRFLFWKNIFARRCRFIFILFQIYANLLIIRHTTHFIISHDGNEYGNFS